MSRLGTLFVPVSDVTSPPAPVRLVKQFLTTPSTGPATVGQAALSPNTVRGIRNCGNACYLNAVLQLVVHCPPLAHLAVATALQHGGGEKGVVPPVTVSLGQWIASYWNIRTAAALPVPACFTRGIRLASGTAGSSVAADGLMQEDAHEFFVALLKTMDADAAAAGLVPEGGASTTAADAKQQATAQSTQRGWVTVGRGREKLSVRQHQDPSAATDGVAAAATLVGSVFNGTQVTYTKNASTTARAVTSAVVEPFRTLAVAVSAPGRGSGATPTVADCIAHAFAREAIEHVDPEAAAAAMQRRTRLGTLPTVLIVQLQRWAVTREGDVVKLDNVVALHAKLVVPADLQSATNSRPVEYALRTVVCHRGHDMQSGHYVAYVVGPGGAVSLADDMRVSTSATLAAAAKDTPYMLAYTRC